MASYDPSSIETSFHSNEFRNGIFFYNIRPPTTSFWKNETKAHSIGTSNYLSVQPGSIAKRWNSWPCVGFCWVWFESNLNYVCTAADCSLLQHYHHFVTMDTRIIERCLSMQNNTHWPECEGFMWRAGLVDEKIARRSGQPRTTTENHEKSTHTVCINTSSWWT